MSLSYIEFADDKVNFNKPDGTKLSSEELYELFDMLLNFLFNNMVSVDLLPGKPIPLPDRFIEMCPKFDFFQNDYEDPLEFFSFLCALTKPHTAKLNENKERRKTPTDLLKTKMRTIFRCEKCLQTLWEFDTIHTNINLLVLLERR